MRQNNRWHPCLLPDNYQRKLKQDLAEAKSTAVNPHSRLEPETEDGGQDDEVQVRPLDTAVPAGILRR